ncbi:MAG: GIY-YIG nuclease family protein [Vicingaceae bacterium]
MYYTYILYSEKLDRYYIGYSEDPECRLRERHNQGKVKSTKPGIPYRLKAKKEFVSKEAAIKEESRLKRAKNREYLQWLIEGNW